MLILVIANWVSAATTAIKLTIAIAAVDCTWDCSISFLISINAFIAVLTMMAIPAMKMVNSKTCSASDREDIKKMALLWEMDWKIVKLLTYLRDCSDALWN